jgi:DNA-binding NtrC family response regulator
LFYRLNVFHIAIPPLRDRKQDIPPIAAALLRDLNNKHGCRVTHLSPDVLEVFESSSWPGNVRELRNTIERAVIMAGEGEIQLRHLAGAFTAAQPRQPQAPADDTLLVRVGTPMSKVEEAYIRLTLKFTNHHRRRSAELLGLSLRTLHNKLRLYGRAEATTAGGNDSGGRR